MSTLTRFKAKKEREKAEAKARRAFCKAQQKLYRAEEKVVYKEFKSLIKPFDRQTIDGLKIKIVCKDAKMEIHLIINGELYRIFNTWTEPHYCNCSQCAEGGSCGHITRYTQEIECYIPDKKGGRDAYDYDYVFWYGNTLEEREERFVESFDELIKEYKPNMEWYGNPKGESND